MQVEERGPDGFDVQRYLAEEEGDNRNPVLDHGDDRLKDPNEEPEPIIVEPFDPTKIQIQMRQDTLRNLIERLSRGEIDMNTDFQRHADLWSDEKKSRLIESILIRFPLPAFYFDASDDDKWLIVDGLQRLSSIRSFVIEKSLKLNDLEYLKDLEGKDYESLHRSYQRRINECQITLFMIMPGTPEEVKYSVFRRINTGGLVLNNQEIRNALAKQRERDYLENLAKDSRFTKIMGDKSKRMQDQELVLRFLAFYSNDFLTSGKNLTDFLDDAMGYLKSLSQKELDELGGVFRRAIATCHDLFEDRAFEKWDGVSQRRKRKNSTLFELWMVCVAKLSDNEILKLVEKKELVQKKQYELIKNEEFFRAVSLSTQKREHVRIRYQKAKALIAEVLNA